MIVALGSFGEEDIVNAVTSYLIRRAAEEKNIGFIDLILSDGTHDVVRVDKEDA